MPDLVPALAFLVFLGTLIACAVDTIRHANKAVPPKSH